MPQCSETKDPKFSSDDIYRMTEEAPRALYVEWGFGAFKNIKLTK